MDWGKQVVRRTLEGAGEDPRVQFELLLQRLESCPEAHFSDDHFSGGRPDAPVDGSD